MTIAPEQVARARWWMTAAYVAVSLIVLALYSSYGRPIWYDESVGFVAAGFDSVTGVLGVIHDTTTNVNQGTTGAVMLAVYGSVSALGASTFAMRLPSLLLAAYLLMASLVFLRTRRVPFLGQLALPIVLVGQSSLMYHVGEARPYMPLAAAVAGILAYYSLDPLTRSSWAARSLGWSAMLIGVLFHPYFILYWPLLLLFAYATRVLTGGEPFVVRGLVRFANPWLVGVGVPLYFVVAGLTWLRGTAESSLDPYLFLVDPLWKSIIAQLFQFVYVHRELEIVAVLLLIVTVVLAYLGGRDLRRLLIVVLPPVALIVLAYAVAYVLALISIQQAFWVIPRQWIGSMILVPLGLVWLVAGLLAEVRTRFPRSGVALAAAYLVIVCWLAAAPALVQVQHLRDWAAAPALTLTQADLAARLADGPVLTEDDWVAFAQANIDAGGPVWPDFSRYYTDRDWSTFRLEDGHRPPIG